MSPRRRPQPKPALHASRAGQAGAPRNGSMALIQSDGKAIRDKTKKEYDRTQAKLRRARDELERFNSTDRPDFDRWFHSNFGALLTRLRECQQQTAEAESLVSEIEAVAFFEGCSHAEAYRRVLHRREHPEPPPKSSKGNRHGTDSATQEPESTDASAFEEEEEEASFEDFLNELFGEDLRGGRRRQGRDGPKRRKEQESQRSRPSKELYRELVRRLHPDRHRDLSAQRLEWWHQVQAAYEAGDTEQMEIILALCEIEDAGHTHTTSLSLLQRITRQLKKALRELLAQIRGLKLEPAWNFSKRNDLGALKTRLTIQLESDLHCIQERLREFQRIVEELKQKAARKGRGSSSTRRRRRVDPFEFYFA